MARSQTARIIPFSSDFEKVIIAGLLQGWVPLSEVCPDEFSKAYRPVYQAIVGLSEKGAEVPFSIETVSSYAQDICGGDPAPIHKLQKWLRHHPLRKAEVAALLTTLRQRHAVVELMNEAGEQLANNTYDFKALTSYVTGMTERPVPVAELLGSGFPSIPKGPEISSLPSLSQATGGIYGLWVLGGCPKVGKSTLAWQIAVEYAKVSPVLYYDFENGRERFLYRLGKYFGGDIEAARKSTQNIYLKHKASSLAVDLVSVKPPALIVIDQLQKLPMSVQHRREGLDRWLRRFEQYTQEGYDVLLVSEKSRAQYDQVSVGGYKDSGEIEYTASVGLQLCKDSDDDDIVGLYIVANRDRPKTGRICDLMRVNKWKFMEFEFPDR